ncbi:ABC-2 transporter permease [Clostridium sp. KNHs214]|uniref:ABC-2 transporter permease n=1 Tax=Clostridium sp. KNHs214 TaxID=1540257 RepID=UPI0005539B05|nr:ABC-2 transporter permease [Clostridium sp. KNHs214]
MINLIRKDLIIVKKSIIIFILLLIPITYGCYKLSNFFNFLAYVFIIFFMSYFTFTFMESFKYAKETLIVNSLPIKREEIVMHKYLMLILYVLIFGVVVMLETTLLKLFKVAGGSVASPWTIVVSLTLSFIVFSFYNPFSINNTSGAQKLNSIIYIFVLVVPGIMKKVLATSMGEKVLTLIVSIKNINLVHLFFLCIGILFYFISFGICTKIYKLKDF